MSEVESHAKEVLRPLLRGNDLTLDEQDQATLCAWIILRTMVFERVGASAGTTPFYTDDERCAFGDIDFDGSLEPIDGTYIWAFQYRTPQWAARSNVAHAGLHMTPGGPQTHRLMITTAYVGRFGFQVVFGRWPKHRQVEFHSPAVRNWQDALALLWPDRADAVDWPPGGFYLADNAYEPLLDRFIRPGFPLRPRRRRGE